MIRRYKASFDFTDLFNGTKLPQLAKLEGRGELNQEDGPPAGYVKRSLIALNGGAI